MCYINDIQYFTWLWCQELLHTSDRTDRINGQPEIHYVTTPIYVLCWCCRVFSPQTAFRLNLYDTDITKRTRTDHVGHWYDLFPLVHVIFRWRKLPITSSPIGIITSGLKAIEGFWSYFWLQATRRNKTQCCCLYNPYFRKHDQYVTDEWQVQQLQPTTTTSWNVHCPLAYETVSPLFDGRRLVIEALRLRRDRCRKPANNHSRCHYSRCDRQLVRYLRVRPRCVLGDDVWEISSDGALDRVDSARLRVDAEQCLPGEIVCRRSETTSDGPLLDQTTRQSCRHKKITSSIGR